MSWGMCWRKTVVRLERLTKATINLSSDNRFPARIQNGNTPNACQARHHCFSPLISERTRLEPRQVNYLNWGFSCFCISQTVQSTVFTLMLRTYFSMYRSYKWWSSLRSSKFQRKEAKKKAHKRNQRFTDFYFHDAVFWARGVIDFKMIVYVSEDHTKKLDSLLGARDCVTPCVWRKWNGPL
jgi:hypothetical protein